jgi:hypothetical protein
MGFYTMSSIEERHTLIAAIERVEWQVAEAMTAELYRGPFWKARYGERGLRFTRQDSELNLKRLATAIAVDNPDSLTDYYRWLRGLLVFRGMCTRHLRETLDCTGRLLKQALPGQWKLIGVYHNASYQGLNYQTASAAALQEQETDIAIAVTNRLFSPARVAHLHTAPTENARQACLRDNLYHLSYLADAVEMAAPAIFENYLSFLNTFMPSLGLPMSGVHEAFQIMSEEIYFSLPSETYEPLLALVDRVPVLLEK